MIYFSEVLSIEDTLEGGRIKARVLPADQYKKLDEIPYAFPLLPKLIDIKPKVGESVLVICSDDERQSSQRYYIGPIISQPQKLYKDEFMLGSTSLLSGGLKKPMEPLSNNAEAKGAFAKDEETAIYSRKNSDIILSDDDIRIRSGARLIGESDKTKVEFNKTTPAFIKLKHNIEKLDSGSNSQTTIVADDINILSNNGSPYFDLYDRDEQITDKTMNEIIDKAHVLPYGDVLVDFLQMFLQMFKSHTHKYSNLPPCPDDNSNKLDIKYGHGGSYTKDDYVSDKLGRNRGENVSKTFSGLADKLLSKHIRIN